MLLPQPFSCCCHLGARPRNAGRKSHEAQPCLFEALPKITAQSSACWCARNSVSSLARCSFAVVAPHPRSGLCFRLRNVERNSHEDQTCLVETLLTNNGVNFLEAVVICTLETDAHLLLGSLVVLLPSRNGCSDLSARLHNSERKSCKDRYCLVGALHANGSTNGVKFGRLCARNGLPSLARFSCAEIALGPRS